MRRVLAAVGGSAILAFLAVGQPATAAAQTGRISGTVTDSANVPLSGAQITVVGRAMRAGSDESGRFVITGVAPGTYELRAQRLGQRVVTMTGVVVRANEVTNVSIVVSASRRTEKITEAPATLTRLDVQEIQNSVGNSFGGALKQVKGLDYIQLGIMSVAVNARGFNSAFNNRVLQLEDGRIAVLPESGLPLGSFTTIPKVDISSVEVLVGPGSALYGPDASGGVVTLTTKDPRAFQGSTFDASGGSRSFYDIQGRQAAAVGDHFAYKLSAEYVSAKDWDNHLNYAPIAGTTPSPEIGADFNTNVARGEGSLVYYGIRPSGRLELSSGMSKNNTLGLTSVGRNQIKDWKYGHAQLRYTDNNWFGQVYHVESRSGGTYQLNGFAQNRLRYPAITDDSVRSLSAFPDKANFSAGEVQNTFTLSQLNDTRFTWGGQYRHDDVSSKRQWLVDRQTGQDVTIDQKGMYGQLEAPVNNWLKLIAAGRYDKHDFYDAQFSPKAGILVSPTPDQTVRVTYNRAFKSPSILQTSFFYPDFQPAVGVFGNKDGFIIKNSAGTIVNTIDPITPETNNTWELGYKGVINGSLYLDATGYYSIFDRFLSPLVVIANFLTPVSAGGPTTAYDAVTGAKITGATGGPQIPLTYFNVGRAKIHGADVGVRYLLTPTIDVNATTSIQKVDNISRKATDPAEATAFNSPTAKATLGMNFAELATRDLSASWSARFVTGYDFLSGVNIGHIPGFSTFDVGGSYRLMESHARINLSVQNLFSCNAGTVAANGWIASARPSIYTQSRECGFGKRHIEMLNSPEIGTMVFLGLRVDR
jgi:iron complex outermembrane receptor protein